MSKAPPMYSKNRFNFHLEYILEDILTYKHCEKLPAYVYILGPRKEICLTLCIYSSYFTKKPFKRGWYLNVELHVSTRINASVETRHIGIYAGNTGDLIHIICFSDGTLIDALDDEVPQKITLGGIVPVNRLKSYAGNVLKSGKLTIKLEGVVTSWKPYLEIIDDIEKQGKKRTAAWLRNLMRIYFHNDRINEPSLTRSMSAETLVEPQF